MRCDFSHLIFLRSIIFGIGRKKELHHRSSIYDRMPPSADAAQMNIGLRCCSGLNGTSCTSWMKLECCCQRAYGKERAFLFFILSSLLLLSGRIYNICVWKCDATRPKILKLDNISNNEDWDRKYICNFDANAAKGTVN